MNYLGPLLNYLGTALARLRRCAVLGRRGPRRGGMEKFFFAAAIQSGPYRMFGSEISRSSQVRTQGPGVFSALMVFFLR